MALFVGNVLSIWCLGMIWISRERFCVYGHVRDHVFEKAYLILVPRLVFSKAVALSCVGHDRTTCKSKGKWPVAVLAISPR